MPRAFRVAPDGSTDGQQRLLHQCRADEHQSRRWSRTPSTRKRSGPTGRRSPGRTSPSQINATNGKDKAFQIASPSGSDRVGSVTRGVDDRQAVITFAKPYVEWRGMFAGNGMLYPKSVTATPEAFNKGQLNGPGPSAGPFMVSNVDRTAQRITLTRNPKWWGTPPLLDTVTYLVLDDAALIPALQNNSIDAAGLVSLDELTTARNTPGISIRRAPAPSWYHFTFNGAPGSILSDKNLRLAIAKGIDRQAIADVTQRGMVDKPVPLNNHIFVAGQKGYQDNSAVVAYDPEKAKAELDALGWTTQRPVPGEGRPATRDPRRAVRRAEHPAVRPDRAEQPRADRRQARTRRQGRRQLLQPVHQHRGLRHRPVELGGRRVPAVLPDPDLLLRCGKQLRQDRISGDRRQDRAGARRARPGQGARAGQRTRRNDLGRRVFPAVDTVGGQCRGTQHRWRITDRPGWATWTTPRSVS